jgi:hypothetical protein
MPKPSIPAAAEGIYSEKISTVLIRAVDKIGETRATIDLLSYALDAMSSARDREINAIQFAVKQIAHQVDEADAIVDDARRIEAVTSQDPWDEMAQLEALIRAHEISLEESIAASDGSDEENTDAYTKETAAFDAVLRMECRGRVTRIRKVDYVLAHLNRNTYDIELEHYQLKELLESFTS